MLVLCSIRQRTSFWRPNIGIYRPTCPLVYRLPDPDPQVIYVGVRIKFPRRIDDAASYFERDSESTADHLALTFPFRAGTYTVSATALSDKQVCNLPGNTGQENDFAVIRMVLQTGQKATFDFPELAFPCRNG
jgi:hypothetical protein